MRHRACAVEIPGKWKKTVELVHGQKGKDWLVNLPDLIDECCERWGIQLGEPFENLTFNLVVPGETRDRQQVVLKLGSPCHELSSEAAALEWYGGNGAVQLFGDASNRGALLLERATPGLPLHNLDDAESIKIAVRVMRSIWRPVPNASNFKTTTDWFAAFKRLRDSHIAGTGPFPGDLIAQAEATFHELRSSAPVSVLLHGDLHQDNILSSIRGGWLAIDPKGIVGEPAYEICPFIRNKLPATSGEAVLECIGARISIFAEELGIDRSRLVKWVFYENVLSTLWNYEDNLPWSHSLQLAGIIRQLL